MEKLDLKRRVIVLARLTASKTDGSKSIIEVHKDSTFHEFYFWYNQIGNSRKVFLRTSSRIEGIYPHYTAAKTGAGLHLIFIRLQGTKRYNDILIKVFKKKIYRKMVHCAPDDPILGEFPKSSESFFDPTLYPWERPIGAGAALPYASYTTLQKRMDILTRKRK